MKKYLLIIVCCLLVLLVGCNNKTEENKDIIKDQIEENKDIIKDKIENMTLEEKVGQIFFIRPEALFSGEDSVQEITDEMRKFYDKYPCGGIALFAKNLDNEDQIKKITSDIHNLNSKIKVLTCIDEEGGRVARLANNDKLNLDKVESMDALAKEGIDATENFVSYIGSYLKEYGFDIDFAPVADVNTNPENIVIGARSFGSDPNTVKDYVLAYLKGLNKNNIIGCLKHFPGHGDTKNDTHSGYTEVLKTWDELKECELITFKAGIDSGAEMIMTAHIALPNVTGTNLPSTLSKEILTDKLRGELGYDGIIITDALEMGAIHNDYTSAESAVKAIDAGVDILLMPYDYKEAFEGILEAVQNGVITEERLDESVYRILKLKENL